MAPSSASREARRRESSSVFLRDEKEMHDKCGIFGVWGVPNASRLAYFASHMQQHRGQAGAGIVTTDSKVFYSKHGNGIVNDVFSEADLEGMKGSAAIAHVRYPTQGPSIAANLQPLIGRTLEQEFAIAHNGEFANYKKIKGELEKDGALFSSTSDTEIALHRLVRAKATTIEGKVEEAFTGLQPAYSIAILTKNELIGVRDPRGVRPLVLGQLPGGAYAIASETVAFDGIRAKYIGEIERGEAVFINDKGIRKFQMMDPLSRMPCIFEHIYFGRPDSVQFGSKYSNSEIRLEFGRQLYREHPVSADIVVPVPDSAVDCAIGFSEESQKGGFMPIRYGLVRSHYIGRTFIEPTKLGRDAKILRKFNVNRNLVAGKRVVVVDDSIVRGSTLTKLVKMLREGGAAEVHVRISSPPYMFGCYLGIDTAEQAALVAYKFDSVEKIREHIGADSLGYLSKEGMPSNPYLPQGGSCTYCFDGIEKIKRE